MRLKPYLKLSERAIEAHFHRLDHPYKLTFCITYWCNYKCKTCNIWQMKPRDELKTHEIESFFKKNSKFLWVDLTGGEVWLRKDFVDICNIIIDHCPNLLLLHFPTNGYLTDKIVSGVGEIVKRKPERLIVTVSMDGDEQVNDSVRGIEGGWQRQIETFKQLHAMPGVKVVLGMTLSGYNIDQFQRTFDVAKEACSWLTYKDFHVNIAHTSEHFFGNSDSDLGFNDNVDPKQFIDVIATYRKLRGIPLDPVSLLEHEYLRRVKQYLNTGITPMQCHALRSSCFIDSWGGVYPCSIYDKKIGSLRTAEFDLSAIWNSPAAIETQKQIWQFQCPQCWTPCEAYQSICGNFFRW